MKVNARAATPPSPAIVATISSSILLRSSRLYFTTDFIPLCFSAVNANWVLTAHFFSSRQGIAWHRAAGRRQERRYAE